MIDLDALEADLNRAGEAVGTLLWPNELRLLIAELRAARKVVEGRCACGASYDDILRNHQADQGCYPKGATPGMDAAEIEWAEAPK